MAQCYHFIEDGWIALSKNIPLTGSWIAIMQRLTARWEPRG